MLAYALTLHRTQTPITEPITKFGGQPVWIEKPEWPLSRETGEPMQFIAQIALDSEIFGEIAPRMAYLFMTDNENVDMTYEPESGENALILQPGGDNPPTQALATGPTLYLKYDENNKRLPELVPVEYGVEMKAVDNVSEAGEDKEFINQIGGVPDFIQGDQYPDERPWRLVLQLDSLLVPFHVDFGDSGVGYAFVSEDGKQGKFLWQCY